MSEHLKEARIRFNHLMRKNFPIEAEQLRHLEAQQETPAFASQPTEQPAPSSSEAIETAEETKPTLTISFSLGGGRRRIALTESQAATLSPFLPEDTWVSCSLLMDHGLPPVAATGEALTSKGSTPPDGWH